MNLAILLLIVVAAYMVYTMMDSYRAMQKELREIRLKCMGTATSTYTKDPKALQGRLVEGLAQLKAAASQL
jgi:hypothetical protein